MVSEQTPYTATVQRFHSRVSTTGAGVIVIGLSTYSTLREQASELLTRDHPIIVVDDRPSTSDVDWREFHLRMAKDLEYIELKKVTQHQPFYAPIVGQKTFGSRGYQSPHNRKPRGSVKRGSFKI
jgi:hypothetical protein